MYRDTSNVSNCHMPQLSCIGPLSEKLLHIPLCFSVYIYMIVLSSFSRTDFVAPCTCLCAQRVHLRAHKIGASTTLSPLGIPCPTRGRDIPSQKFHSMWDTPSLGRILSLFLASFMISSSFTRENLPSEVDFKCEDISHTTISPPQSIWAASLLNWK